MTRTLTITPDEIERRWYLIDATGKTLGRLSTEIAVRLRGKHKPEYTPNMDLGDYIVVINASKIRVTGKKMTDKIYFSHSGYTGGIKSISFKKLLEKNPERIIEMAVKGMIPKGPLGRQMLSKLNVYAGAEHPHAAQKPQLLNLTME